MHNVSTASYQQFQKIFELHYNALCNYAYSFIKDVSSCEDIVQEVFVKIWEKKKDIITSDAVRFYLFTAVRNNCLTYLQREKRAGIVELNDLNMMDENVTMPGEVKTEVDYASQLKVAMDQLPQKCREVFELSRISKQSYKEIADTLDISVKTVENQIGKALKILRAHLQKQNVLIILLIIIISLLI